MGPTRLGLLIYSRGVIPGGAGGGGATAPPTFDQQHFFFSGFLPSEVVLMGCFMSVR